MLEQALSARIAEQMPVAPVPGTQVASTMPADPAKQAALQSANAAQQKRQAQDQSKQLDQQIAALQKQKADLQNATNSFAGYLRDFDISKTEPSKKPDKASTGEEVVNFLSNVAFVENGDIVEVFNMAFVDGVEISGYYDGFFHLCIY